MVTLHEELDMAHKTQQKLDRTVRHVQSLKEMQEKLTLSVLKSRAVDSDIIEVQETLLPCLVSPYLACPCYLHLYSFLSPYLHFTSSNYFDSLFLFLLILIYSFALSYVISYNRN
jgi:hypothetical protein